MDGLGMIECLYMSWAEKEPKSREDYRAVFYAYLENIYTALQGDQELIMGILSEKLREKIEQERKYNDKDIIIACIMAGKILQEIIDEQNTI